MTAPVTAPVRSKRGMILVIVGVVIAFIIILSMRVGSDGSDSEAMHSAQPVAQSVTQADQRKRDDELINSEAAGPVREQDADTVERQMLEQGYDMTVRAVGARKSVLRFQWVSMSRPVIYGFINNKEVVCTLKAMGFKCVVFTDGVGSTWQYEVDKLQS